VNIDMAALHAIEADKGISVDVVVDTIKSALLPPLPLVPLLSTTGARMSLLSLPIRQVVKSS